MMRYLILCTYFVFSVCFASEKLDVILDWFPNPDHAPLIVADQLGYFKEQGLIVNLIGPADPTDPPKLVAAKKADIGITYEPEFMQQVDRGLPLVCIGTLIDKPLTTLTALTSSGIKNIADLKGKRIGSSSGSGLSNIMLNVMLVKAGLSINDVTVTRIKYNLTQALLSGKIDAATGMMRNFEIPQIEKYGKKPLVFFPEDHGIANYSELIFITHLNQKNDQRMPRFLNAIKKAVAYLDHHPKEAWVIFAKKYPEANNEVNRLAWFTTLPYFAEEPSFIDHQEWQKFALFMEQHGLIKKRAALSRYIA